MKKFLLILFTVLLCTFAFFYKENKLEKANVVKFSSWGSQTETQLLKELLDDFEKTNNIKVEFQHIPQNYFQKIHLLFSSNLEPDVIFINNHYLKMYAEANLLEDLTEIFKEDFKNYHEVSLNCLTHKGKIYAIPRDISALVLYINKDIIKDNINPKTIYELRDIAKKYTNKNHFGINYEEDPLFWLYYLASNGGGVISDDGKSIILDKRESYEALDLYSDYSNKYHIAPTKAEIASMTTAQMFINGKLAMYLGGRWMLPKFKETIAFKWDIVEFPSSETNKIYIDSSGWAIAKKSQNKENAIKLVKFLSSEEALEKLSRSGLITPARKIKDNENIFTKMLNHAKPTPTNTSYNKINDILRTKGESVLLGEKTAEEAFDENTIKKLESLL